MGAGPRADVGESVRCTRAYVGWPWSPSIYYVTVALGVATSWIVLVYVVKGRALNSRGAISQSGRLIYVSRWATTIHVGKTWSEVGAHEWSSLWRRVFERLVASITRHERTRPPLWGIHNYHQNVASVIKAETHDGDDIWAQSSGMTGTSYTCNQTYESSNIIRGSRDLESQQSARAIEVCGIVCGGAVVSGARLLICGG